MKSNKILLFSALIIGGVYFYSCSKEDDAPATSTTTPFELRMTDASAVYDSVNIDIVGVEVKSSGGGTFMLNVNPGVYNLLDYANGVDTLIASANIPTSTVSQVRLILGDHNSVVVGGVNYPLNTPSAQESGLKLQVHEALQPGVTYYMLIDFDANKSIVETGSGQYNLKPVIRVISKAASGSIHGSVTPSGALPAVVMAITGNDTVTTSTDGTGNFLFQGMLAGTYNVVVVPQAPYSNTTISNVNVTVGVMTEIGPITVP